MIKLKILRWEDHAGLYRWALMQLQYPYQKEAEEKFTDRRGGSMAEVAKSGAMKPQAKQSATTIQGRGSK